MTQRYALLIGAMFALISLVGQAAYGQTPAKAPAAVQAVKLCPATPADAKLDIYPLFTSGPMITTDGAGLGLRPVFLRYPFQAHNHHREINPKCGGTWIPEVIPAGTLVWVNDAGYVAYKADCANRLVYNGPVTQVAPPAPPQRPRVRVRDFWRNLFDFLYYGPFVTAR